MTNSNHCFAAKIALTIALAASCFLLSEKANAQTNGQLPSSEKAIASVDKVNLQLRKDQLKELKNQLKAQKAQDKILKEERKLEKVNMEISKLCQKPLLKDSLGCLTVKSN